MVNQQSQQKITDMENNINLTPDAVKAIQALQYPCGTYQFYRLHLDRLFNYILNNSDEIGMSDNEAMYALRALNALRSDIADIAGSPAPLNEPVDPFDSITLTAAPDELDEAKETAADLLRAYEYIKRVQPIIEEAGEHAKRAGLEDSFGVRITEISNLLKNAMSLISAMANDDSDAAPTEDAANDSKTEDTAE